LCRSADPSGLRQEPVTLGEMLKAANDQRGHPAEIFT